MTDTVKTVDSGQSERRIDRLFLTDGLGGAGFAAGTFTATAAGTTTITDASVGASSTVVVFPLNGPAGLIIKSKSCYVTPAEGSFTFNISATGAGAPAGTESFGYMALKEIS